MVTEIEMFLFKKQKTCKNMEQRGAAPNCYGRHSVLYNNVDQPYECVQRVDETKINTKNFQMSYSNCTSFTREQHNLLWNSKILLNILV